MFSPSCFAELLPGELRGRLLKIRAHVIEHAGQGAASAVHGRNNSNRNARCDQAVFYRGRAGLIRQKA
jgi:hypothetical protein